jgi:hypothetical protein
MTDLRPLALPLLKVIALQSGPVEIRRKVTPQPGDPSYYIGWHAKYGATFQDQKTSEIIFARSPFGPIGTRFWVREPWYVFSGVVAYVDPEKSCGLSYPARLMSIEYARLFPALTALRVEQVAGVWYWIGTFEQVAK